MTAVSDDDDRGSGPVANDAVMLRPGDGLACLPGVGKATAERLQGQGLQRLQDLLRWFPRRYRGLVEMDAIDLDHLGELVRLRGTVRGTRSVWLPKRRSMVTVEFAAADGTPFSVSFFNQPWLKKSYQGGEQRLVEGVLDSKGKRILLKSARILPATEQPGGEVQLHYPVCEGVSAARLQRWIAFVLEHLDWSAVALLPLPPGLDASDLQARELYLAMHRPASVAEHERARASFAVREVVALFERVERARRHRTARVTRSFVVDNRTGRARDGVAAVCGDGRSGWRHRESVAAVGRADADGGVAAR